MKKGYRKETIYSNNQIGENIFELKIEVDLCENSYEELGKPGQFYMLRGWEANDPFFAKAN